MVCRWSQELLGYHFSILHRRERIIRDVDAISHRFDPLVSLNIRNALVLSDTDRHIITDAYTNPLCDRSKAVDFSRQLDSVLVETPILTTKALLTYRTVIPTNIQLLDTTPVTHVSLVHVLLYSHLPQSQLESIPDISTPSEKCLKIPVLHDVNILWLLVNNSIGAFQSWSDYGNRGGINWDFT